MTSLEIASEVMENGLLKERIENYLHDRDFDAISFEQNEEI